MSGILKCAITSWAAGADGPPTGAFRLANDGRLLAVADAIGPGSRTAGSAYRTLQIFFDAIARTPKSRDWQQSLCGAFEAAHAAVSSTDGARGVAAAPRAVALAAIVLDGSAATIAHVGNIHCYHLSNGSISQLTHEHSAVAELRGGSIGVVARADPFHTHHRDLLTRALGLDGPVAAELLVVPVQAGDRFLLCTAGVWSQHSAEEVRSALDPARSAEDTCRILRSRVANDQDGYVIVVAEVERLPDSSDA